MINKCFDIAAVLHNILHIDICQKSRLAMAIFADGW